MSIRKLPAVTAPDAPEGVRWDLHPQARDRWERGVTAAAADGEDTISILEPIGIDFWTGEGVTAKRIAAALRSIGDKPVTVLVNSPGGDFFEGLAIYNLLREHPKAVRVEVLGIAASAASIIAMAGDTIAIGKAAMMFIHNTQWFAAGDRHVMAKAAEEMKQFDDLVAELYADRTGQEPGVVHRWMDKETFFSGGDAVEEGFADELLKSDSRLKPRAEAETPAAYRLEALLERHNVPRAERRKAVREFIESTPGAALDPGGTPGAASDGTPGAADCDEGLARLRAARMRFNLN
jgi:ATP-dependent Clp protease, protease subunit